MVKWEYRVIMCADGPEALEERLNKAGQEGWELVAVKGLLTFFLKRPIPAASAAS